MDQGGLGTVEEYAPPARRRRWIPPLVLIVLIAAVLAVTDLARRDGDGRPAATPTPCPAITQAFSASLTVQAAVGASCGRVEAVLGSGGVKVMMVLGGDTGTADVTGPLKPAPAPMSSLGGLSESDTQDFVSAVMVSPQTSTVVLQSVGGAETTLPVYVLGGYRLVAVIVQNPSELVMEAVAADGKPLGSQSLDLVPRSGLVHLAAGFLTARPGPVPARMRALIRTVGP